jgi:hypothetical protein
MNTDSLARSQGKTIKIGWNQLNNPTPEIAKIVFRIILYISALWAMVSPAITEIDPATLATVNKYLLLANGVVNVTIRFFGWDIKSTSAPAGNA